MAHIHLIHNAQDAHAAERIAYILYFLDYDVNLLTSETPAETAPEHFGNSDVILVLWTPNAQKDRWLAAQCRDLENAGQLITLVPRTPESIALPLMLHRGSIVNLEHSSGKMHLTTLETLLSEIGHRSGRDGLVSVVAALLRTEEDERVTALTQWVAAYPNDTLAPTVATVLQNNAIQDIHDALAEITNGLIISRSGLASSAVGIAEKIKIPNRITPQMSFIAIGVVVLVAFLATLLPIINRPTDTVEIEKIDVPGQVSSAESAEFQIAANTTTPSFTVPGSAAGSVMTIPDDFDLEDDLLDDAEPGLDDISLVETDLRDEDEFEAEGDVESEFELDPVAEPDFDLPALGDDDETLNASLILEAEEPSLGVPDPDELTEEAVTETMPEETPEAAEEKSFAVDLEAAASQAELFLPYIPGEQRPGDAFTDRLSDETGAPVMIVLPTGTFTMGSPLTEPGRDYSEGPQRSVSISRAIAVSRHEVTIAQYNKFVVATSYDVGDSCQTYADDVWASQSGVTYKNTGFPQTADHPVTCVDWFGANAYAEWLSRETGQPYRLLSEAEWEYAARAGSTQAFPFGSNVDEGCAFMNGADQSSTSSVSSSSSLSCSDDAAFTAKAGSYLPNRFGLHDMHGSVWEWTQDSWHASYDGAPRTGRAWDTGNSNGRVVRGGSWFSFDWWLRSASRRGFDPADRRYDLGFRVAREL